MHRPGGLLVGAPLLLLCWFMLAAMAAWIILGLPLASFDPLKMPQFFWYYRGDPLAVKGLLLGAAGSGILVGAIVYFALNRDPSLHGDARFAKERELRREGLRASRGIVLGRKGRKFLIFAGSEHVIVEAPTRSGKGVGIVIPNLLTWEDSVVVLDVKRENFDASAGFRAAHGQQVFLFNPTARDGRTARYNPLGYIERGNPDAVIVELQKVATMLFTVPDKGDSFWMESAKTGFVGVGAHVANAADLPFTIGEIYRQFTQPDIQRYFLEIAQHDSSLSGPARQALADFTSGADKTFSSILQSITSKMSLWLNPLVCAATAHSDFDLRDLRSRKISIYLGVSPDEMDRVAPLYNLFFQQLIDLNTRDLPKEGENHQVLLILDEFARLGRASVIAGGFAYVAGYGIRLLPVIQSRSQLRAVYGHDVADEIVANCGVEVAFTPKELKVAKELSERLGYVGQDATTKSLTIHGMLANRSKSVSQMQRALLLPQELMQFPRDQLLLLRGGIPAVRGTKIKYYRERIFKSRVLPAPDIEVRTAGSQTPDKVDPRLKVVIDCEDGDTTEEERTIIRDENIATDIPFLGISFADCEAAIDGLPAQAAELENIRSVSRQREVAGVIEEGLLNER
ncbi:conjugal transfer protein TraG [Erythrobacter sp. QSSC1-22B]|uniref:type IV secretory system conjugative DNA transfer family protein n=1 Tax=Erythrobacter sp. QSSC1-22B TaxID=1860125 RepID=UPI000805CCA2|nr:conjugal transfer protein TraG [Erythrobacter sp. QSSC1-22B]